MFATGVAAAVCLAGLAGATQPCTGDRVVALTFDDLPAQRSEHLPSRRVERLTAAILAALAKARAPAVGFVNLGKIYDDGKLRTDYYRLLEDWRSGGHELGNHTYSHPDLHRVPLADFLEDVSRSEEILRGLAEASGGSLRYFRHPFLHTGRDLETREALEAFLAERGYRVAPVTVDNSEWIFARAMDEALDREDGELAARLEGAFVDYMLRMVAYYETQSCVLFDRLIPQVLLLHANALNGRALGDLLDRFSTLGYRFETLEFAVSDSAYSSANTYTGPGGITWLHRWALTRGVEPVLFRGEPTTPAWVQEVAGISE